jgi:hypothetical protein
MFINSSSSGVAGHCVQQVDPMRHEHGRGIKNLAVFSNAVVESELGHQDVYH